MEIDFRGVHHDNIRKTTGAALCTYFCTALLALLVAVSNCEATSIVITPASTAVQVGDVFTLALDIQSVTDLYAFQVTVDFDPGVVQALSSTEGTFLQAGGGTFFIPGTVDNVAGSMTFLANTLFGPGPGVSGSGTIATLGFSALAPGASPIAVVVDLLNGDALLDSALNDISANALGGSVTVTASTPVPEPGTLLLLGVGFAASVRAARRRSGSRTT